MYKYVCICILPIAYCLLPIVLLSYGLYILPIAYCPIDPCSVLCAWVALMQLPSRS